MDLATERPPHFAAILEEVQDFLQSYAAGMDSDAFAKLVNAVATMRFTDERTTAAVSYIQIARLGEKT